MIKREEKKQEIEVGVLVRNQNSQRPTRTLWHIHEKDPPY